MIIEPLLDRFACRTRKLRMMVFCDSKISHNATTNHCRVLRLGRYRRLRRTLYRRIGTRIFYSSPESTESSKLSTGSVTLILALLPAKSLTLLMCCCSELHTPTKHLDHLEATGRSVFSFVFFPKTPSGSSARGSIVCVAEVG